MIKIAFKDDGLLVERGGSLDADAADGRLLSNDQPNLIHISSFLMQISSLFIQDQPQISQKPAENPPNQLEIDRSIAPRPSSRPPWRCPVLSISIKISIVY